MNTLKFAVAFAGFLVVRWLPQDQIVSQAAEGATGPNHDIKVERRQNAPLIIQAPAAGWRVSTTVGGLTLEVPVHVSAEQCKLVQSGRDRQWSSTVYAFAIASEGTNRFEWSCWAPSFPLPHNFGLFRSAKGKTYAGLVGDGIRLFEVSVARPGDRMQENYLARKPHPDELPTLSVSTMLPVMGTGIISSRKFDLVIDRVDETPEGLTVAVRSSATTARFTFLLQNGQWRLLRD